VEAPAAASCQLVSCSTLPVQNAFFRNTRRQGGAEWFSGRRVEGGAAADLLVRGEEQVRLEPRVMDVLVHLAERANEVVSKEELIEHVWKGRYVTDDVLSVAIYSLRKSLGDDARRPRYVETVSRRGYRLIAPMQPAAGASPRIHAEAPRQPEVRRPRWYSWSTVAATVVLALAAASALWVLTAARHRRHVPPAEAHEAYLKGRYFLDQRSIRGWRQALEQFERAVALDPRDPAAQAGLADAYSAMSDFGVASPAEMRPRAMKAAQRALELDPQSAAGLAALGRVQFLFDWDFAAADRSLARAVALDPDYMPAHQTMAWLKSARGQHAEAVAAAQRALQLDPVNTARYTELAWVLALSGRQGEALREIERALQLNPRSSETYLMKGWACEVAGQADAAFAAYREGLRLLGVPEEWLQRMDAEYRAEGLAGCYRGWVNRRGGGGTLMSETRRAQLYVRMGELDRAIESLEHAYQKREGALAWVNVDPSYQPLRSDARFQQIAARVGRRN
jgi:DNA-binding winged helix-turn-helix (wHTH) protein/tetratricopeptide (TPR) repeat protein